MDKTILRTCIVTRKLLSKEEMFRIVKTPNHEIKIDSSYVAQGRGCYLSRDKSLILKAKSKRMIEKHLKVGDCQKVYDELLELL